MSKIEVDTIDTVTGTTELTIGGTNATDVTLGSGVKITNLESTGIDDNATSTAITVNSDNNVALAGNIGLGGATPTTSGTGITFPATASASTNANTLDDYEEGTWTPIITGGFTGTPTYTAAETLGRYTKIGDTVFVIGSITIASITTAATALLYGGLPFTQSSVGLNNGFYFIYNRNYASGGTGSLYLSTNPSDTTFYVTTTNGIAINGNSASVSIAGNAISFMGFYRV